MHVNDRGEGLTVPSIRKFCYCWTKTWAFSFSLYTRKYLNYGWKCAWECGCLPKYINISVWWLTKLNSRVLELKLHDHPLWETAWISRFCQKKIFMGFIAQKTYTWPYRIQYVDVCGAEASLAHIYIYTYYTMIIDFLYFWC